MNPEPFIATAFGLSVSAILLTVIHCYASMRSAERHARLLKVRR